LDADTGAIVECVVGSVKREKRQRTTANPSFAPSQSLPRPRAQLSSTRLNRTQSTCTPLQRTRNLSSHNLAFLPASHDLPSPIAPPLSPDSVTSTVLDQHRIAHREKDTECRDVGYGVSEVKEQRKDGNDSGLGCLLMLSPPFGLAACSLTEWLPRSVLGHLGRLRPLRPAEHAVSSPPFSALSTLRGLSPLLLLLLLLLPERDD
jgi:hypothetical protein